jgi:RNA polymerase sigma-70 factor (ECF subfamily)
LHLVWQWELLVDAIFENAVEAGQPEACDPDAMLMASVASGDLGAFEQLVLRYQERAWRLAWRMLGDTAEVQDVVQDAFLKIFRSASRYRPTASFRTYLFRIVARLCFDVRSRKKPDYGDPLPDFADPTATPEEILREAERSATIGRALASLSPRHRAAVLLRHDEGLSYREIAAILEISEKSVDSLLQRARQSLRLLLKDLAPISLSTVPPHSGQTRNGADIC